MMGTRIQDMDIGDQQVDWVGAQVLDRGPSVTDLGDGFDS
jgi:hypothetical protein